MNVPRWSLLIAALMFAQAPIAGVTEVLTERDVADALNIANASEAARALFHAPYRIAIDDPTVEQLEVITEFRRLVLAAEDQLNGGNWVMGRGGYDTKGRTLKDVLRPLVGQVSIRVKLRFHPLNSYVTLPAFDILLGDPTLLAINAIRTPSITHAIGRETREVLNGATIETFFNAPTIADRVLPVRMSLEGKELARVRVDFSRFQ